MSATRTQTQTGSGSATTLPLTFVSSTTSGNYIIVGIVTAFTAFSALTSVTDNKGNTYTQIGTGITVGNGTLYVYRAQNITGGASHIITGNFSGSGQSNAMIIREYGNIATTTPTDQTGTATGSGTAVSVTAGGALAQANELSILFVGTQNTGETLSATGYGNATTVSGGQGIAAIDGDLTSTSTPSVAATITSFSSFAAMMVTVKEAGGGGGPTTPKTGMLMGMGV